LAKNLDSKAVSQHNSQFDFVGNGRVSFADAIELAEIAADGVDRTSSKQSSVQGEQLTPLNNQTENIINRTSGTNSSASGTSIQTNNSTVENKKHYSTTVVSELNKSQQSNRTMRYNGTLRNTSDGNFHIERDQSSTNNTDTSGNSTGAATMNHSNNYQSNSSPDDSIQRSNQSNSTVDITDTGGDGV
jgi:epidermal growth factor receptor substrate 15